MSLYIGDLHGCPDEPRSCSRRWRLSAATRSCSSGLRRPRAAVRLVDRLLRLGHEPFDSIFLRGNHEDMLSRPGGRDGGDVYLENGGGMTLASYGIPSGTPGPTSLDLFPADHVAFFRNCRLQYLAGAFLFVHAGIRPGVPLTAQDEEDLLWIREEFFSRPHALPYTVVFGHTPTREARVELPYRIGLDTGLVYGNKLSCLDVAGRRLVQVARGASRATECDLDAELTAANL
jgi:serine/threonine protein phosphatase 1